jgi:hypothetical protein
MRKFILSTLVAGLTVGVAVAGPGGSGKGGGSGGKPSGGNQSGPSMGGGYKPSGNWNGWGGFKTHSGGGFVSKLSYHQQFGKSFSHGFCYVGKNHCHWTYSCWWPKYGCNAYWCPSTCCYYYWCEPTGCYYPISYISYAPPVTVVVAPVQVQVSAPVTVAAPPAPPAPYVAQTQVQTQTQTQGVGGPPPGIPALPQ